MSWFSSICIGLLTGLLGCLSAGFLTSLCVRWFRISSFEGNSGYFVIRIGLLGGIVGLIGGIVGSRFVPLGDAHFFRGLGWTSGGLLGVVLIIGVFCRLLADIAPTLNGKDLELVIEVRSPAGFTVNTELESYGPYACVWLPRGASQSTVQLALERAVPVDGRLTFPVTLRLDTSASEKQLRVCFNPTYDLFFPLPLRSHPKSNDLAWSNWIEGRAPQAEPMPDMAFAMRYRVQTVEPPSSAPMPEASEASKAAQEQATFDAIPAEGPVTAWLPYTRYGADDERRRLAVERIMARSTAVSELGALMVSPDQELAADALRLIEHIPLPTAALVAVVKEAGRGLITRLRQGNTVTSAEDESYVWAADVSIRFRAWMTAVRALREKGGGDFTPELGEILELSRVREDSQVMRSDVRRVASYYMHEWAGLEPLTSNPKPK